MQGDVVDIAMYHSISDAGGPTSIAEAVFRSQMSAIAGVGAKVISLDDLVAWRSGGMTFAGPSVVLTFDDGFADFAEVAWPVIREHGWPVTVYLPTGHVGGEEGWRGKAEPPRKLMSWEVISRLAREGVTFGGHSVSHADLNGLDESDLGAEILGSLQTIEERTGQRPRHFAPPYGMNNAATRGAVARHFETSCGTALGRAGLRSDLFDLPRLEMFYFTDMGRWRAHLAGTGAMYLGVRKVLRGVRSAILKPWSG